MSLPEKIKRRETRLAEMAVAKTKTKTKTKIAARAAERHERETREYEQKMAA